MSKTTGVVAAVLGMCALSLFLASCGSSSDRPTGLLYVLSQAENNVSSYAIDLNNGDLSLITENMPATCPTAPCGVPLSIRSEEHTSELQSLRHLVCRLLLEK